MSAPGVDGGGHACLSYTLTKLTKLTTLTELTKLHRMSAPGVDGGATLGKTRLLYQGLFNAPMVVGEACKGAALVTEVCT